MVYSPSEGKLHCPYCDSTRVVEKSVPVRRDFIEEQNKGVVWDEENTYQCPNCGGTVLLENFATATACPFCGATNIVKKENMPGLRPDSILPFAIEQKQAFERGKKWVSHRIFAPHKLKKDFKVDNFKGVYIPSFAFDAYTSSSYNGRLGERRTRTVGSGNNRRVETYIYWYYVNGTIALPFEEIMIEASTQLDQKELAKIAPYDMGNAESYMREYVAGFSAERYDTSLSDSFGIAKEQMDNTIRKAIIDKYHADVVGSLDVFTNYNNIKFRYTLLPLWVCAYKFKEKLYRFIVNGRTGKSTGKTPVSPVRVSLAVLLGIGIIALIAWLFTIANT